MCLIDRGLIMVHLDCPRCKTTALTAEQILEKCTAYRCQTCDGVFLPECVLEKVEQYSKFVLIEKKTIQDLNIKRKGLFCPDCQKVIMLKKRNSIEKDVLMDICPKCNSVWLDGGELNAIMTDGIFDLIKKKLINRQL
jgi:Zn-finger nucleic acid-binding protein